MDNSGRLYAQVAAEAGVGADKAMIACYLSNLARDGKTMDEAARLLRKERADVRDYARNWGIPFRDYERSDRPLILTWRKEKRGQWKLWNRGECCATADADGGGGVCRPAHVNPRVWRRGRSRWFKWRNRHA
jgi:hypothetical protein